MGGKSASWVCFPVPEVPGTLSCASQDIGWKKQMPVWEDKYCRWPGPLSCPSGALYSYGFISPCSSKFHSLGNSPTFTITSMVIFLCFHFWVHVVLFCASYVKTFANSSSNFFQPRTIKVYRTSTIPLLKPCVSIPWLSRIWLAPPSYKQYSWAHLLLCVWLVKKSQIIWFLQNPLCRI